MLQSRYQKLTLNINNGNKSNNKDYVVINYYLFHIHQTTAWKTYPVNRLKKPIVDEYDVNLSFLEIFDMAKTQKVFKLF